MVAASRWSWPGRATLAVPATVNASAAGLAPGANRRADPTATAARRIRRSTHEDELRLRASPFTEDAGRAVSPDRAHDHPEAPRPRCSWRGPSSHRDCAGASLELAIDG